MKGKTNIVIITSALSVDTPGINSLATRIYQTLSTVNSIKANMEQVEIWVLDASHTELHSSVYDMFPSDVYFFKLNEIFKDEVLKIRQQAKLLAQEFNSLYKTLGGTPVKDIIHSAYIKNRTEIFMLNRFLEYKDLSDYNRLYKISGRYMVSTDFNQHQHNIASETIVFKNKDKSNTLVAGLLHQYPCMFWSIDTTILPTFKKIVSEIEKWIEDSYLDRKQVVDLEHAFYKFTTGGIKVKEIATIGIIGLVNNESGSFFCG